MSRTDWLTRNVGYDPGRVVAFGIQFTSGGAGAGQGPVTLHIDSFSIEGLSPADAGAAIDAAGD